MRWYVNRNGQTSGPVDESQVVEWIRLGMHDATVRDEAGGNWMPLTQSPFAALVPKPRGGVNIMGILDLCLIAYALYFAYGLFQAHQADVARVTKEKTVGKDPDPKFCSEWLSYYESFCTAYPDKCKEGPQKLARCVPW